MSSPATNIHQQKWPRRSRAVSIHFFARRCPRFAPVLWAPNLGSSTPSRHYTFTAPASRARCRNSGASGRMVGIFFRYSSGQCPDPGESQGSRQSSFPALLCQHVRLMPQGFRQVLLGLHHFVDLAQRKSRNLRTTICSRRTRSRSVYNPYPAALRPAGFNSPSRS